MKFRITFSLILLAVLTLSLLPTAFAGKVYKWVDKDGSVHYSAEKPAAASQELKVKSKPSSSGEDSETQSSDDDEQAKKEKTEEEKVKVSSEKEAAEVEKRNEEVRKKNCSIAKRKAATIEQGGRLYEVDESGERHYWDDDTRRAKMDEAETQIKEWCK